ncbi:hypothetical protein AADR41_22250 [Streptomyces sp. CLV115]|uniref:hypothetical protein n=1 Tax=Streptomyces sp. CLV115 TaxID=3138502 RepID=UPI00313AB231
MPLQSRRGSLIQGHFPDAGTAAGQLPQGLVLDGDLVVWSGDRLSPEALQRRAASGERTAEQFAAWLCRSEAGTAVDALWERPQVYDHEHVDEK